MAKTEEQKQFEKAKKTEEKSKAKAEEKSEAKVDKSKVEESKVESEKKISKFINHGKDVKIRIGSLKEFKWITAKHGQIVELDDLLARANGLSKVE